MSRQILILFFLLCASPGFGQVKIHAHNDFENTTPLYNALENKVFSIEADVILFKGNLLVTHSEKERRKKKTLSFLYLNPIISLFEKNKGRISADSNYRIMLMIDIKQNHDDVLAEIVRIMTPLGNVFDRSVNPMAVQVIISGDRGPSSEWKKYPSYIYFDGRPTEEYSKEAVDKLALISDNYFNYLKFRNNAGDSVLLSAVINKAHALQKPMRFWGGPDTEAVWQLQKNCGADLINTDNPEACRKYFERSKL